MTGKQGTQRLPADIIIADNASSDDSVKFLQENYPELRLIQLDKNYGFTGGYNRAFEAIQPDGYEYYLLLNSDIETPQGWLEPLEEWMDEHPECGACGPKLLSYYQRDSFEYAGAAGGYIDRFGYPFCRGRVLQKIEKDLGQYDDPTNCLWCSGAALMIRAELYHRLGGLDERFFAHMEEIDLCWRAQLEGYQITCIPASKVYHVGGGTLPSTSPFKLQLNYRNNLLLLRNNLARTFALQGAKNPIQRAQRLITVRMCLDGLSALIYLLTFKFDYFKAVYTAHQQYKSLKKEHSTKCNSGAKVYGLYPKSIILRSLFHKNIDIQ